MLNKESLKMYDIKPEKMLSGIIKCTNCNLEIKWHYIIHPKEFGMYIGSYPSNSVTASKLDKNNDSNNKYCVKCRNCDKMNYFEYREDI